jgi:hypothetical protein
MQYLGPGNRSYSTVEYPRDHPVTHTIVPGVEHLPQLQIFGRKQKSKKNPVCGLDTRADVHVFREDHRDLLPEHLEAMIAFHMDYVLPNLLGQCHEYPKIPILADMALLNGIDELASPEKFQQFWETLKEKNNWKIESPLEGHTF